MKKTFENVLDADMIQREIDVLIVYMLAATSDLGDCDPFNNYSFP